jgi:signal transduction histidine kinase
MGQVKDRRMPEVNFKRDARRLFLIFLSEKRALTGFLLAALALILLVAAPAYTNYRSSIIRMDLSDKVNPLNASAKKMRELILKEKTIISDLLAAGDEARAARRSAMEQGEKDNIYRYFMLSQLFKYQEVEEELKETIDTARPIARSLGDEPEKLFEEAVLLSQKYREFSRRYLNLYQSGRTIEARLLLASGESINSLDNYTKVSEALIHHTDKMRNSLEYQLEELNRHGFYLSIPLVLIGLVLLLYILFLLTSSILLLKETDTQKQEIEQQRELLVKANRVKDEFLGTLSHELRTPLTPILGWTAILKKKQNLGSDVTQAVEVIERSTKIQAQIINDLLDLSKINNRKLDVDKKIVDLNECVVAAISVIQPVAAAKGIKINESFFPAEIPINADPLRIQQAVWNLLSNAVKYNYPKGQITISTSVIDNKAQVSVSDSGIGIKPEILSDMFTMFKQADNSVTRMYGGLGIGLTIVKSLVEIHDGTIHGYSEGENKGSSFTITLPLAARKARAASAAA